MKTSRQNVAHLRYVLVINTDDSGVYVIEPKQQADDSALARPRRTNQGIRLTRWNKERDSF